MIESTLVEELSQYSTPSVLNGLKQLGQRPEEFAILDRRMIQCLSPALGVRVGFAATTKVATRQSGENPGRDRIREGLIKIAESILATAAPRFLATENVGDWRGPVCIWGEVTANLNAALNCRAGVTNGPVRDLPEMESAGFQAFAGGLATGGGYVDLIDTGGAVSLGGVKVNPGDLLHGDRHGLVKIPAELAAKLPEAIAVVARSEQRTIEACRSADFDLAMLVKALS
jgi:hypothetical protein